MSVPLRLEPSAAPCFPTGSAARQAAEHDAVAGSAATLPTSIAELVSWSVALAIRETSAGLAIGARIAGGRLTGMASFVSMGLPSAAVWPRP